MSMVANSSSPPHTAWAASASKFPENTDSRQKNRLGLVVEQVVAPIHHPLQGTVPIPVPGPFGQQAGTVDPAGGRSRPGSWPPCAPRPARSPAACRPGAGRSAAPPHGSRPRPQRMAARRRPDPQTAPPRRRPTGSGATGTTRSPGRCSGSRLVANTVNSAAGRQQVAHQLGHGSEQVFAVVHDQQRPPRTDHLQQLLAGIGHRRCPSGPGWPASTPPARRDD